MVKRPRREYLDHHRRDIKQNIKSKHQNSQKNNTFKYMFFYGLIIFLVAVIVILYINQYVQISRKNFKIEKLEEKRDKLRSEKTHLQLKISRLKSLDRIERIAKEELGMKEPSQINYIVLDKSKEKQELRIVKNKELNKDKITPDRSIKEKVLAWFNNLTEVQAGTLDE